MKESDEYRLRRKRTLASANGTLEPSEERDRRFRENQVPLDEFRQLTCFAESGRPISTNPSKSTSVSSNRRRSIRLGDSLSSHVENPDRLTEENTGFVC